MQSVEKRAMRFVIFFSGNDGFHLEFSRLKKTGIVIKVTETRVYLVGNGMKIGNVTAAKTKQWICAA
jgi:hypothetical protein